MEFQEILAQLPYSKPFLFVDGLSHVDDNGVIGTYTLDSDHEFYRGHFKTYPVTPGVILTECCAQIGLVCLGIFLKAKEGLQENARIAMSSTEMEFLLPVYPGETVTVKSEKLYFRFNKLKCKVSLFNEKNQLVCKGQLAGMLMDGQNE